MPGAEPCVSVLSLGSISPIERLNPVSGLPVVFGGAPVVVVFVRDLHGTTARVAIKRLTAVWPSLDAAGVRLAVVTHTDLTYARDFVPRHHVIFPLVVDEDRSLREKFGLETDATYLQSLRALRPRAVRAWLDGLNESRDPAKPNGDLGGEFVFDRHGTLIHARGYSSVLDVPDADALLACSTALS